MGESMLSQALNLDGEVPGIAMTVHGIIPSLQQDAQCRAEQGRQGGCLHRLDRIGALVASGSRHRWTHPVGQIALWRSLFGDLERAGYHDRVTPQIATRAVCSGEERAAGWMPAVSAALPPGSTRRLATRRHCKPL